MSEIQYERFLLWSISAGDVLTVSERLWVVSAVVLGNSVDKVIRWLVFHYIHYVIQDSHGLIVRINSSLLSKTYSHAVSRLRTLA